MLPKIPLASDAIEDVCWRRALSGAPCCCRFVPTRHRSDGVDKLMRSFGTIAETINPLAQKLGVLSDELTQIVQSVDQKKVSAIVENVDRFTAALGSSSGDVGKAVKDVASITDKLNRAADQVEGVLKSAQTFLNTAAGSEGRSAFQEVADAAKSIRVLADNLDKRTAEITTGISRFTGPGLRESRLSRPMASDFDRSQSHFAQYRAQPSAVHLRRQAAASSIWRIALTS